MTSINDPIRQASLYTSFGLTDPRLMPGYVAKPKESRTSLRGWMKLTYVFSFGKKPLNA